MNFYIVLFQKEILNTLKLTFNLPSGGFFSSLGKAFESYESYMNDKDYTFKEGDISIVEVFMNKEDVVNHIYGCHAGGSCKDSILKVLRIIDIKSTKVD